MRDEIFYGWVTGKREVMGSELVVGCKDKEL